MATNGIEAVFVATHNWGRTAKFFLSLGFELSSEGDGSGVFRNGDGAYVVVAEVPEGSETGIQIALSVPDAHGFEPASPVEVVSGFENTHYGTAEMTIRDPDGRLWSLQAPPLDARDH
ncbi:VOC family protein [Rhodococcus sp. ACT016]|uniref:VOC family protein n=1 Tax=Rhodococcus sp. ACT016 TaxID=3134808 RepID=UPI003D267B2D